MKKGKKWLAVLAAAACVMTQLYPATVQAAVWVDDSSDPNGGYYIDDDGYVMGTVRKTAAPVMSSSR